MRIAPILLLLPLLFAASGCSDDASAESSLVVDRLPLSAADPQRSSLGEASVLGILRLSSSDPRFGGLSGMILDGERMLAVTDAGHWASLRLRLDGDGRPLAAEDLAIAPLGGLDGSADDGDAEELLALPGGVLVSFERRHRLHYYPDGLGGTVIRYGAPADLAQLPNNNGIEAMARLADGRLLLIAENGKDGGEGISPAWVGRPGQWERLSYRREGLFFPTGATLLPDGAVLLVERRFTLMGGVSMRLTRVEAGDIRPGAALSGKELALLEPPLTVDNFESVVVRPRADGRWVAYVLSDDNFNPLQATLLMAILLPR